MNTTSKTISEPTARPIWAMTAPELAAIHNITARHVRRLHEDGLLPSVGRGRYCFGWMAWLRTAQIITAEWRKKPRDAADLVAIGFTASVASVGRGVSAEDRDCFVDLFKRNGRSKEDALQALGTARALLML